MKVIRDLSELKLAGKSVVTTGTFDGVHQGHLAVLQSLLKSAKKINGESVLLTFHPHPRLVLQQDTDLKLLSTLDEKIQLLDKIGLDYLVILPFTKEFSRLSSLEFVREILVNELHTKKLVIGYNHHFGRNREGSFDHLKEFGPVYGFEVEEIPAHDINNMQISSTKIREALLAGNAKAAAKLLGYAYSFSGTVIHGNSVGKSIGFPTANLSVEGRNKLIPKNGVYAVNAIVGGKVHKGMLNIGHRPTFESSGELSIEVHIFDFNRDIYGSHIRIELVDRLREEKQFQLKEDLLKQLEKDKVNCQKIFQF